MYSFFYLNMEVFRIAKQSEALINEQINFKESSSKRLELNSKNDDDDSSSQNNIPSDKNKIVIVPFKDVFLKIYKI